MIVLGSVVYKNALPYLEEFFQSINDQTAQMFDVLLINDDINYALLKSYTDRITYHKVTIINEAESQKSPVELRVQLLREAKKRSYNLLVLGDCDDKLDRQRIKLLADYFEKNSEFNFYYNDLLFFDGSEVMSNIPKLTESIEDVLEYNYLGLSNSAINLDLLDSEWINSLSECDNFVFDWYFFSRILIDNGKGVIVPNAHSLYRIHDNNFAGKNILSKDKIVKEYNVKIEHYRLLSKYSSKCDELYKKYLKTSLEYVLPKKSENSFWWSNIRL